jgi:hypothetical protein
MATPSDMHGLVGIFNNPDPLREAAIALRDRKVKKWDAFTPFPVHGLDEAMGLKRSFLPWVTFAGGLFGASFGLLFQIWAAAVDWKLNVGGKPPVSLPAFIPITFECTILFAGLATAAAMIIACRLPNATPLILDSSLTNDRMALFVAASDPVYDEKEFIQVMKKAGAHEVRVI